MKYNIWDIVKIQQSYYNYNWETDVYSEHKEWVIVWYSIKHKIPVYRVRVFNHQYRSRLFSWYRYQNNNCEHYISQQIFRKMFNRAWMESTLYPVFESLDSLKKFSKKEYSNSEYLNYRAIIKSKIWERDNEKYNKVLKALEKSNPTT